MSERTASVPYWIVFFAGMMSAIILLLGGVMLGYVSIKPISVMSVFTGLQESTKSAVLK